jgi:hypothetical protein
MYTIQTYANTGMTQEQPHSGWRPVLLLHQKKVIYQKACAAPKIEYLELARVGMLVQPDGTTSKLPSHSTLYRTLKRAGLTNHRLKKRHKLNCGHVAKHLQFCRQHQHFQWHQRTVKFLNECSVQKGSGQNQEWCFWFPWEKWKPEMITAMGTGCKPQQMVWAAIWLDEWGCPRRSKLVIMNHDPDAQNVATLPKVTWRP